MENWQKQLEKLKDNQPEEKNRMITFYKNGHIDPVLVHKRAMDWANEFYPNPKNTKDKKNLTSAQIRKFYGEVLTIEEKLKSSNKFELVYPQILMLKSKAAYAANPSSRKIPDSFRNWIDMMIDNIKDEKDFKAFKLIFEAIVGYFYGKGAK